MTLEHQTSLKEGEEKQSRASGQYHGEEQLGLGLT